jgi:hypothetical protein
MGTDANLHGKRKLLRDFLGKTMERKQSSPTNIQQVGWKKKNSKGRIGNDESGPCINFQTWHFVSLGRGLHACGSPLIKRNIIN